MQRQQNIRHAKQTITSGFDCASGRASCWAMAEPGLLEEVGGILDGLSGKLPEAHFNLDGSSDEVSLSSKGALRYIAS